MFNKKGFTLIDVLVGSALMLIVFFGIFGAYQLGAKVVGQSKNRITASAIANQWIEKARNLPYSSIGVQGGFPDGVLESFVSNIVNNTEYLIENRVDFVVDPTDGLVAPQDECPNDYKRFEVKVSWAGRFPGDVKLSTDISPKNTAQECSIQGGILGVSVFDAFGVAVPSPVIQIKDPQTDQNIKTAIPVLGEYNFSLTTSTYKVVVSKSGYSTGRTFAPGEVYNGRTIVTPTKPHFPVLEDQLTSASFSIDGLSSFSIKTLSPQGQEFWADSFLNESKIQELSSLTVAQGKVSLASTSEGYSASGYLVSQPVAPANLMSWREFSWTDFEDIDTDLNYQIYYSTNTNWLLIPDVDLAGNSEGFDVSPVDLSGLSISEYFQLEIRGNFSTNATATTPILNDWQISWATDVPTPIPHVSFSLRGNKIVGYDAQEEPIYKYSLNGLSDSGGQDTVADLEWDSYAFSINPASGLDLVSTDPQPQPFSLPPSDNLAVKLYLQAENSLLIIIQDEETLEPVFGSAIRLYNAGLGYDNTQYTNERGQTYFIPLTSATYNLEVQSSGYENVVTSASVFNDTTKTVRIREIE